jgi:hypothetical protein
VTLNTEPIAIVYGYHQARLFPEVKRENVIPFRLIHLLKDRQPSVIYRTGLGKSWHAWRMLEKIEELVDGGSELIHLRQMQAV